MDMEEELYFLTEHPHLWAHDGKISTKRPSYYDEKDDTFGISEPYDTLYNKMYPYSPPKSEDSHDYDSILKGGSKKDDDSCTIHKPMDEYTKREKTFTLDGIPEDELIEL